MAKGKRHLGLAAATIVTIVGLLAASVLAGDPHEREMYSLIDDARVKHVLASLETRPALAEMAERQAQRMADGGRIWHNQRLIDEMHATGESWRRVGENVGSGYDLGRIQTALMKSPSHRRNLLDPKFNAVGIGVAEASDERLYITQVFAWITKPTATAPPAPKSESSPTQTERFVAEDGSYVERSYYTSAREAAPSAPSTSPTRDACVASSTAATDPSSGTDGSSGTQDLHPAK